MPKKKRNAVGAGLRSSIQHGSNDYVGLALLRHNLVKFWLINRVVDPNQGNKA
jgi:hypothetical protein